MFTYLWFCYGVSIVDDNTDIGFVIANIIYYTCNGTKMVIVF